MQKQLQQLIDFHRKYNVPYQVEPDPFDDSDGYMKLVDFRRKLMLEEIEEWHESARWNEDREKRVKELADILYVVFGTIITEGYQDTIERAFDLVHQSNMTKTGGKRGDGKILKGEGYIEPNLNSLYDPR